YIEVIIVQARQLQLAPVDCASFTHGGGTTLLLNVRQLPRLFRGEFDELQVDAQNFKAIETSPSDTTDEKVELWCQLAVYCASN
ncbi:coproporphyrinogen III oxidase family protein, partial [Escherichia coli]|nr:coproporphyrinogen III oxidase family protein [Escherichia coli]